jgi:hypothetical protein
VLARANLPEAFLGVGQLSPCRALQLRPDILDTEKMARTLQSSRNLSLEFNRIAARLSGPAP